MIQLGHRFLSVVTVESVYKESFYKDCHFKAQTSVALVWCLWSGNFLLLLVKGLLTCINEFYCINLIYRHWRRTVVPSMAILA